MTLRCFGWLAEQAALLSLVHPSDPCGVQARWQNESGVSSSYSWYEKTEVHVLGITDHTSKNSHVLT